MLPEIVAEVFRFFSRDELDRLCFVSKCLKETVEGVCPRYPFRHLTNLTLEISTRALATLASPLRQSYVEELEICPRGGASVLQLQSIQFAALIEGCRRGAIRSLRMSKLRLDALNTESLDDLLSIPGLTELSLYACTLPVAFTIDGFLHSRQLQGISSLSFLHNRTMAALTLRRLKKPFWSSASRWMDATMNSRDISTLMEFAFRTLS